VSGLTFVLSDVVAEEAAAAFAEHEARIHERLPHVEIRHIGGTSIRGVLTQGDDVDLQVRAGKDSFETVRDVLSALYEPHFVHVWHPEGAYFFAPDSQPRVEIALSAIGSLDDLHHGEAWQRIAADRDLIDRYNALKREHEGGSIDDYLAAKRDFFRDNFPP
jgi:GrpB-like predicted nucleotidyltransferase (UPF0157 family)